MIRRSLVGKEVVFKTTSILDQYENYTPDNPFSNITGVVVEDDPKNDVIKINLIKPITYKVEGLINPYKSIKDVVLCRDDISSII